MTHIEGNKIICDFMGVEWKELIHEKYPTWLIEKRGENDEDFNHISYHDSWDWLMRVVDKIESLGYCVFIQNDCCWIKAGRAGMRFPEMTNLSENKIEATWKTVIEFIMWYKTKLS